MCLLGLKQKKNKQKKNLCLIPGVSWLLGAVTLVSLARAALVADFCCVKLLQAVW